MTGTAPGAGGYRLATAIATRILCGASVLAFGALVTGLAPARRS